MAIKFKIYYGDGSVYSGDPFKAPRVNVQVIVQEAKNERGFMLVHSKTLHGYYCWKPEGWYLCDDGGFWDYLMIAEGPKYVLFGRTMSRDDDFWQIVGRAGREGLA